MLITRCPICQGELQRTEVRQIYQIIYELDISPTGEPDIIEETWWNDGDSTDSRIYCENDHTFNEMLKELNITPLCNHDGIEDASDCPHAPATSE